MDHIKNSYMKKHGENAGHNYKLNLWSEISKVEASLFQLIVHRVCNSRCKIFTV